MNLRIIIHNVGHGQSIHAFTPAGEVVVIDLGCSDDGSPLDWLRGETDTIDSLMITHPHGDHIDEILELERLNFDIRQIWRPRWLSEEDVRNANQASYSEELDCYFDMSNNRFIYPILDDQRVGNPDVSRGVSISRHFSSSCGTLNINNHSGVTIFEYLGVKVVIPGDNEPSSWTTLLGQSSFVDAIEGTHVFVASHHGRESGYHSDLFTKIRPKLCIVSDGRVQDTDATSRYSGHAEGWTVLSNSTGESRDRRCLTTRTDGYIEIAIGENNNGNPFLIKMPNNARCQVLLLALIPYL